MIITKSPDGFTKIYHPISGIYVGLIWRDEEGRIWSEDRDVDNTDHDTWEAAINWLCRQATMTREAA